MIDTFFQSLSNSLYFILVKSNILGQNTKFWLNQMSHNPNKVFVVVFVLGFVLVGIVVVVVIIVSHRILPLRLAMAEILPS